MKQFIAATAILFFCSVATSTQAQTVERSQNQRKRIKQGVKSGELTKAETKNLVNGQREVKQEVREARADGVVTAGEKKNIRQEQRQQSRKIARKKNNGRDRN
jgi:hypothetical protein